MNKETTKLIGIVGATFTGIFTATIISISKQQEIKAKKEIDLERLELERQKFVLEQQQLEFNKEKFEFEKFQQLKVENVSDYKETFKAVFNNMSESTSNSNTDFPNINSSFESILNSSNLVVDNMSLTFICFTSVTIICTISLTFNYLTKMYGDSLKNKLPKMFHSLFNYYSKYLLFSSLFDLSIILLCNGVGLLLCLYLFIF
jgi:hypothetical protein